VPLAGCTIEQTEPTLAIAGHHTIDLGVQEMLECTRALFGLKARLPFTDQVRTKRS
jgi:hypothetical protein